MTIYRSIALLLVILVTACAGSTENEKSGPGRTPKETIGSLARSVRDRDFLTFYDLHTKDAFEGERAKWEGDREKWPSDPEQLTAGAKKLGVTAEELETMDFRSAFALMMGLRAKADPGWFTHLEHLKVTKERIDGDEALLRVQYGGRKSDEEHDLELVRRDGIWLIKKWD